MRTEATRSSKRVVVKVGSSLLSGGRPGLDLDYVRRLADALHDVRATGRDVVLVTSGAIGAGLKPLGYDSRPKALRLQQAAAAVGQGALMHAYAEAFARHGLVVGQVLLTRDGVESRLRYLNARNTLGALLEAGAIPVINENDTVSVEEIRIGDNDTLAALVTKLVDGDLLIILTDVDGLCTSDPRKGDAPVVDEVADISCEVACYAEGAGTDLGSGGMVTKIEAARMATAAGAGMVLVNGGDPAVLMRVLAGEHIGTFFCPRNDPLEARKFWIAFASAKVGGVHVNDGASEAIRQKGKSLLPVGITGVVGEFERGDTVKVIAENGLEFARGISNYGSSDVDAIRGKKSSELGETLRSHYTEDVVIHRDNLVIL
jgi:glutamate 5-kinase